LHAWVEVSTPATRVIGGIGKQAARTGRTAWWAPRIRTDGLVGAVNVLTRPTPVKRGCGSVTVLRELDQAVRLL
jgi:hypothetical protein